LLVELNRSNSPRRYRRWLLPAVGYSLSGAALVWVYHGFNWKQQIPALLSTDWRWVVVAVTADVLVYFLQGWRWSVLLRPIVLASPLRTIQAIYIGLFANEILPFRTGEAIRAFLLARWTGIPFASAASSVVLERLLDGAWLALGFYLLTHFLALPGYLVAGARALGLVLLIVAGAAIFAALRKTHASRAISRSRWARLLRTVFNSTHDMLRSKTFLYAALLSLAFLALQVVPVYALLRGFGIQLGLWPAMAVLIILRLGSVPPQAPSNVGTFQFFTVVGLRLFDVPRPDATAFATLLFLVVTVPLWIGGFIALLATRMRLGEIRAQAESRWSSMTQPGD